MRPARACLKELDEYSDAVISVLKRGKQLNGSAYARCSVYSALVPIVSSSNILL